MLMSTIYTDRRTIPLGAQFKSQLSQLAFLFGAIFKPEIFKHNLYLIEFQKYNK
jgi:hypothetical protein